MQNKPVRMRLVHVEQLNPIKVCPLAAWFEFSLWLTRPQQNVQKGYVLKLAATVNLLILSLLMVGSVAVLSLFYMHVHFFTTSGVSLDTRCRTFLVQ